MRYTGRFRGYRRNNRRYVLDPLIKTHPYNEYIRAPQVRVIDEEGKNLGVFDKSDALALAKEKGLDLVIIALNANPPVAKLVNLEHFRYELQKKEKFLKKKQKEAKVKEVKFKPLIDQGDYERKLKQIRKFVESGHPVKITIMKKRRVSKEIQDQLKQRLLTHLQEYCKILDIQDKGYNIHILVKAKATNNGKNSKNPQKEGKENPK